MRGNLASSLMSDSWLGKVYTPEFTNMTGWSIPTNEWRCISNFPLKIEWFFSLPGQPGNSVGRLPQGLRRSTILVFQTTQMLRGARQALCHPEAQGGLEGIWWAEIIYVFQIMDTY